MLIEPLWLTTPLAAFNGGMFVKPDLTILEQRLLPPEAARKFVELIGRHGLDVWVYREANWYVTDPKAPHVDREQRTVRFAPTVVREFGDLLDKSRQNCWGERRPRCRRALRGPGPTSRRRLCRPLSPTTWT